MRQQVGNRVEWISPQPYAAEARRRVRENYPSLLYTFAKAHGLLTLWSWKGSLSVWWLMQISEMSSLRTPLINFLYQFEVIDQVLRERKPKRIVLLTDDPLVVPVLRQIAQRHDARVEEVLRCRRRLTLRQRLSQCAGFRRSWFLWQQVLRWMVLRLTGVGRIEEIRDSSGRPWALHCTLFPSMWEPEADSDSLRNRSFGDWPKLLEAQGYRSVYGAVTMAPASRILLQSTRLHRLLAANRIVLLESLISFRTLLACCVGNGWIRAYRRWRRSHQRVSASFNGTEVGSLLLREVEHDLYSPEIPFGLCVAEGTYQLARRLGSIGCITYPFEYQPLEKAFTAGIRQAGSQAPVIGFQTGLTGRNHLGYWFPMEQVCQNGHPGRPDLAPLPEVISVNGGATLEVLRERLAPDRLVLTGPVRLARLRGLVEQRRQQSVLLRERYGISDKHVPVAIATSIDPEESLLLLNLAFQAGKWFEDVLFLVKDHPLCPLRRAVRVEAMRHGARYRQFTGDTADLLLLSRVAITGNTSVGVEALALGCMPIVYDGSWHYDLTPLRDAEEAAFFFHDAESLRLALSEGLTGGEESQRRQARWQEALDALLSFSNGDPAATLLTFLNGRGVLVA